MDWFVFNRVYERSEWPDMHTTMRERTERVQWRLGGIVPREGDDMDARWGH